MTSGSEWATNIGDIWKQHWQKTDAALSELGTRLHAAILESAPNFAFRAMDIGCGPGSTSDELARARPDAAIVACDLSPSLIELARNRLAGSKNIRVVLGDAETVAATEGPFDLYFSRHGVMFFPDPVGAFQNLRAAAAPGANLVFSCFQDWEANPWASELSSAAAGRAVPAPGREPSGFAFADPDYVRQILSSAGWTDVEARPTPFRYVAGDGIGAVDHALDFLAALGPASRTMLALADHERGAAMARMRSVIERYLSGNIVEFPAAARIYLAKAN